MTLYLISWSSAVFRRWVTWGITQREPLCGRAPVKPVPSPFWWFLRAQGHALSSAKPDSGLVMVSGGAFALRLSSSLLSGAWEPVPWGESIDPLLSHYSFPDSPSPGGSPKNLAEDSTARSPISVRSPLRWLFVSSQCPNKEHSGGKAIEKKRRGKVGRWERGTKEERQCEKTVSTPCEDAVTDGEGGDAASLSTPSPAQARHHPARPVSAHQNLLN